MKRRFFHSGGPGPDGTILLQDAEAHHAAQVVRLQEGDSVVVLDGAGGEFTCSALVVNRRTVRLRVEEALRHKPPPCRVRLVQAVTKGKSFDLILQKAVELGATEILPLLSERVVARPDPEDIAGKLSKWGQITVESIKQCGSPWLPSVLPPMFLSTALDADRTRELRLIASLAADARHPHGIFDDFLRRHQRPPKSLSVWIGPEGDFSPAEMGQLLESGLQPVSLGASVLRSETAAISALAIVGCELSRPR